MLLPMTPTDSVFLTAETRQTPMHVGGLQLFQPPDDFGDVHQMFSKLIAEQDVAPLFRKRARRSITTAGQWGWEPDEQFDLEHHVRHNALPRPGRVLELLALCSRLHGTLLDRKRPLWELHLIEGLNDGRFAIYFKIHHALVDGVSAQRLLQSILTKDPDVRDSPAPWANRTPMAAGSAPEPPGGGPLDVPLEALRSALDLAAEAAGLPRALARAVSRGLKDEGGSVSFAAPRSMFNVPIAGARRFAAQSWPLQRFRAASRAVSGTVNDAVLAVCSGALRRYLLALDALPEAPLIAMVPVALRAKDRHRESGNAVGAVMCNLATDQPDPAERLRLVRDSMLAGKQALSGMTPLQIVAMTGLGMSPLLLQSLPGYSELFRPPFNIIISNVPGPRSPLYLNGARMDGLYPLSIPYHGQALNITCTSYADEIAFGLTGCRRTVPHLQHLLGYLDDELAALETALGIG
ncbi:MAG TPA: wax ester/triacylglycerol synthase family O-acyltransferase [Jatrophihabitans sp.]|nr:wax ester/triacylglycerol synthase family O-acyltransferase [Jatrophihabitans sp.]